ncbi:g3230 [Coccomyxa elongata]
MIRFPAIITVLALTGSICQGERGAQLRRRLLDATDTPDASGAGPIPKGSDQAECSTPWELFNTTAELSFWAEALQTVGFAEEVNSPYVTATFFAPTNDAFAALLHALGATPQQLLADPSIVPILLYHMIPGEYDMVEDLHDGDTLVTSISTNLTVGAAQAPAMASPAPNMTVVTIRSAESVADIVKYNLTACMSVVHEVDQVFVPDFQGVTSSGNRVVYALGDGSGQPVTVANFTLILPGGDQNISDIADPVYQITDAGLMFSVTPPPI